MGKCGGYEKILGEVWESVLRCGEGKGGNVGRNVGGVGGGVGKCRGRFGGVGKRVGEKCRGCGEVCWGKCSVGGGVE